MKEADALPAVGCRDVRRGRRAKACRPRLTSIISGSCVTRTQFSYNWNNGLISSTTLCRPRPFQRPKYLDVQYPTQPNLVLFRKLFEVGSCTR